MPVKPVSTSSAFGRFLYSFIPCSTLLIAGLAFADADADAKRILDATGIQGGLVIQVGVGDGALTAALRANERYQVHGVDQSAANVASARKHIRSLGAYGDVAVDVFDGKRLPYIDDLANLVVSEDLGGIAKEEVMRILAPNGVAYLKQGGKWTKTVKPWPSDIDEWTHLMHDASGNAVAKDTAVGPPRHLKWVGSPRWSRHHDRMASMSALVSAKGRLFFIMDEGSRISIQMPPKWTLVARDAFNGTVLWKRKIDKWHSHLWPLKSGPTQLARRLVAVEDVVYATLSIDAPLVALNAATGETIRTYEGTKATEEIIASKGQVFALVNDNEWELKDYNPFHNTGDQARVRNEFAWDEKARKVVGIDAQSGKLLWTRPSKVAPLTLACDDERVYFHDDKKVVCLDRNSGKELWTGKEVSRKRTMTFNFGPKLVAYKGVLLYAGGERTMVALDAKTGKELWTSPHEKGGYQSPEDLLVLNDLIWTAPLTSGRDSGVFTGRNFRTGEVEKSFPPNVETYWFHHRCYIAKATENFLLPSRTGIEFVDPAKEHWDIHHWVRGGCLYGIMPCNGLTYAPPHNCACYPEAKLYGFNALASAKGTRANLVARLKESKPANKLVKGPAFGAISNLKSQISNSSKDWPTFRNDASRSGSTKHAVSTELKEAWKADLGGRLSAVVVGQGRLFVSQIDQHRVVALDGKTGKELWSHTTGGRVDSPPTFHKGTVLFGSTDGWVYCLRANDGELVWKFQAALADLRLPSFEQLESVWPVHGSVLVQDDFAYFVAGRSNFLDGGMRLYKVRAATGDLMNMTVMDDVDPETGNPLQDKIATLQMPVGLPDILSCDGSYVYMRSQKMDLDGTRLEIGPVSGNAQEHGQAQEGDGRHLFAPMGFLDDTWFHRSYWVYGKNFAGGHNGYYQAGKATQAGRILVFDQDKVYGFGRKAQYLKWTTTLEHQLYASTKEAPKKPAPAPTNRRGQKAGGVSMVRFDKPASMNPKGKAVTVEAWVKAEKPNGVVIARGGPLDGFALIVEKGRPAFNVRASSALSQVIGDEKIVGEWAHLAGVLTADKNLQLFVNGRLVATGHATGLLATDPKQGLEIGADEGSAVGEYTSPNGFNGLIDEPRVYLEALTPDEIAANAEQPGRTVAGKALILSTSFDKGGARDVSGKKHNGKPEGTLSVKGKVGNALKFTASAQPRRRNNNNQGGSIVKHLWNQDVPLLARAMVLAGDTLWVAGPEDVIDEEASFKKLTEKDQEIQKMLKKQDGILDGKDGAKLIAYSAKDGKPVAEYKLDALPAWDGMAAANDRLYVVTAEGGIVCLAKK